MKEAAPEIEIQTIRLYDYTFTGCRSCFACQLKRNRNDLQCWVKDDITQLLKDTYHADGIVFASPIYYCNVTAQLRAFWERLLYPGHSMKKIPTAIIYTMNMNEEQEQQFAASPLQIINMYLTDCFGMPPETIHSYNTFQFNDRPPLNEDFRRPVEEKKKHREEQFPKDMHMAFASGKQMVQTIQNI